MEGSEISDPSGNLGKSISLQILIEGLGVRCFQQNSTSGSLGKSYYNRKTGFWDICKGVPFDSRFLSIFKIENDFSFLISIMIQI